MLVARAALYAQLALILACMLLVGPSACCCLLLDTHHRTILLLPPLHVALSLISLAALDFRYK